MLKAVRRPVAVEAPKVFENLLRELSALSGIGITVSIPTDTDGYLDRECPNDHCLFEFKVEGEDWRDRVAEESAFCPMCRHKAPKKSWFTTEQVEFMQANARAHLGQRISEASRADARAVNASQRPGQFITMRMTVKDAPAPLVVPLQAAEPMRQRASCEACGCRYSYIGSAFFCPCCGHNSAVGTFRQTLAGVRLAAGSAEQLRAALPIDDAEVIALHLREKGMSDVVTALQRLGERLWETLPGTTSAPRNIFQRLDDASQLWHSATGKDFTTFLNLDEMQRLRRGYQQRHLLAHAQGIVDADYIRKSGDTSVSVGQRIVVTETLLLEFVALGEKLAEGMIASCPTAGSNQIQPVPAANTATAPSPAQLRALSRFSPHAIAIARLLAEKSSYGRENDPQMEANQLRDAINLSDDDIAEAVYELEHDGLVFRHQSMGMEVIGFYLLSPTASFFQAVDPAFGIGNPTADARVVAAALIEGGEQAGDVPILADKLGWAPRRMNPALAGLIAQNLVVASREMDPVWAATWIMRQPGLRAFAQQV